MLTNIPQVLCSFDVFCGNIADHLVSSLTITCSAGSDSVVDVIPIATTRALGEINLLRFRQCMSEFDFETLYTDDSDLTFDRFCNVYLYYYNMCCPLRVVGFPAGDNKRSWVTSHVVAAGKELKDIYWLMVRAFPELRDLYKNLKKIIKRSTLPKKPTLFPNSEY